MTCVKVNESFSTFCFPPDLLHTLEITTQGFCWDLLRGWRTKEPLTSYPASLVTPGSGTAVTGCWVYPCFSGLCFFGGLHCNPTQSKRRVSSKDFFYAERPLVLLQSKDCFKSDLQCRPPFCCSGGRTNPIFHVPCDHQDRWNGGIYWLKPYCNFIVKILLI